MDGGTAAAGNEGIERVFYDGDCGLCHHAVGFLLARDEDGSRFRFAPLGGETFERTVPPAARAALPDSIVLQQADGTLLLRSDAALHAFSRLGGGWKIVAALGRLWPRPLRDLVYDGVARVRKRLFAKPAGVCPVLPPPLRKRFEA